MDGRGRVKDQQHLCSASKEDVAAWRAADLLQSDDPGPEGGGGLQIQGIKRAFQRSQQWRCLIHAPILSRFGPGGQSCHADVTRRG